MSVLNRRYIFCCIVWCSIVLGCGTKPAFQLQGDPKDVEPFIGTWEGTYQSDITGRAGMIQFFISAADDSAHGLIVMIPRGWGKGVARADSQAQHDRPDLLHEVRFHSMRISGQRVEGTVEQYRDPDCGCDLETSFKGELTGDRISGIFTSREVGKDSLLFINKAQDGTAYTGRWQVQRSH